MDSLTFRHSRKYGVPVYFANETNKYSLCKGDDNRYYIRIWESDIWKYVSWEEAIDGFRTIKDAQTWLNTHNWQDATFSYIEDDPQAVQQYDTDFKDAIKLLGMTKISDPFFKDTDAYEMQGYTEDNKSIYIRLIRYSDVLDVNYWVDGKRIPTWSKPADTLNIAKTISNIERMLKKYGYEIFANTMIVENRHRSAIMAAFNTKDLAKNLVKVRSSNVWAYGMNIKNRKDKVGDLVVQFKDSEGGPGDVYIYYDVPIIVYRRWQSAPSKGHYFWVYIRNNYSYSKLTGDKRGKLKNVIN